MAATGAGESDDDIAAQMRACLDARGGEVSTRNRAARLAEAYVALDEEGRLSFFRTLASFDSDLEEVATAMHAVSEATDEAGQAAARVRLRRALEPPNVIGLVVGRSLLYPPGDDVAAAVDAAAGLLGTGAPA